MLDSSEITHEVAKAARAYIDRQLADKLAEVESRLAALEDAITAPAKAARR